MIDENRRSRRPYVKPTLIKVKLRPEEAVLGSCKSGSVVGPLDTCTTPSSCFDSGS
jgi:hypothetical protein